MINEEWRIAGEPVCPNPDCKMPLDGFTGLTTDQIPNEGDITLCGYCGEVCQFDKNLHAITLRIDAYLDLPEETRAVIDDAQAAIYINNSSKGNVTH